MLCPNSTLYTSFVTLRLGADMHCVFSITAHKVVYVAQAIALLIVEYTVVGRDPVSYSSNRKTTIT